MASHDCYDRQEEDKEEKRKKKHGRKFFADKRGGPSYFCSFSIFYLLLINFLLSSSPRSSLILFLLLLRSTTRHRPYDFSPSFFSPPSFSLFSSSLPSSLSFFFSFSSSLFSAVSLLLSQPFLFSPSSSSTSLYLSSFSSSPSSFFSPLPLATFLPHSTSFTSSFSSPLLFSSSFLSLFNVVGTNGELQEKERAKTPPDLPSSLSSSFSLPKSLGQLPLSSSSPFPYLPSFSSSSSSSRETQQGTSPNSSSPRKPRPRVKLLFSTSPPPPRLSSFSYWSHLILLGIVTFLTLCILLCLLLGERRIWGFIDYLSPSLKVWRRERRRLQQRFKRVASSYEAKRERRLDFITQLHFAREVVDLQKEHDCLATIDSLESDLLSLRRKFLYLQSLLSFKHQFLSLFFTLFTSSSSSSRRSLPLSRFPGSSSSRRRLGASCEASDEGDDPGASTVISTLSIDSVLQSRILLSSSSSSSSHPSSPLPPPAPIPPSKKSPALGYLQAISQRSVRPRETEEEEEEEREDREKRETRENRKKKNKKKEESVSSSHLSYDGQSPSRSSRLPSPPSSTSGEEEEEEERQNITKGKKILLKRRRGRRRRSRLLPFERRKKAYERSERSCLRCETKKREDISRKHSLETSAGPYICAGVRTLERQSNSSSVERKPFLHQKDQEEEKEEERGVEEEEESRAIAVRKQFSVRSGSEECGIEEKEETSSLALTASSFSSTSSSLRDNLSSSPSSSPLSCSRSLSIGSEYEEKDPIFTEAIQERREFCCDRATSRRRRRKERRGEEEEEEEEEDTAQSSDRREIDKKPSFFFFFSSLFSWNGEKKRKKRQPSSFSSSLSPRRLSLGEREKEVTSSDGDSYPPQKMKKDRNLQKKEGEKETFRSSFPAGRCSFPSSPTTWRQVLLEGAVWRHRLEQLKRRKKFSSSRILQQTYQQS